MTKIRLPGKPATKNRGMTAGGVCPRDGPGASGVITVFLSLILPVILMVFATCLESARFEGLRLKGQLAADAAVQSVFAGYDRPLYERYGLLFVSTAGTPVRELEETAKTYAIRNTQSSEGNGGNLLGLKLISTEASAVRTADQEGGRVFLQAVGAYMQESGRMEAARIAAAEAEVGGFGQTKIALVEYLMREFSALTDEGAAGCQLEHCATGAVGKAACLLEVQRRIYEARYELYLDYFRALQRELPEEAEGPAQEEGDSPATEEHRDAEPEEPGGPASEGSDDPGQEEPGDDSGPAPPLPEDLAREAAIRDVGELLNGGAVPEHADGSGGKLTYLQYLRRWLYRLDAGVLQRRAMEAIRDDLRSVEPAFDFSNCFCSCTVSFCFRSEPVMPFSVFSRSYEFRYASAYAY